MGREKYSAEFKDEAIKQVTERNYPANVVAERLGVSRGSLYQWLKAAGVTARAVRIAKVDQDKDREIAVLKAQVKRLEEERDILNDGMFRLAV